MRTIAGIIAILFGLLNLMLLIAAVAELVGGSSETEPGIALGVAVFFLGLTLGCAWFAKRMLGHGAAAAALAREQTVLELAQQHGGRVTIAEVAAETRLTVAEAQATLERLSRQGVAERHLTDDHATVFAFRGLMSAERKAAARDPLAE